MRFRTLFVAALAGALFAAPVAAQLAAPLMSKLQVNFVNPGGKSLAMGGAFVSLADDPTASFSNPAGIVGFGAWNVGVSGKYFGFEPTLATTALLVQPAETTPTFQAGVQYQPKTTATDLEFVSVAGPLSQNLAVSLYRAVNLRYSVDSQKNNTSPYGDYRLYVINVGSAYAFTEDEQGTIDLKNEVYGLSLAARLGALSVGGGVTLNKLTFDLGGSGGAAQHLFIANRGSVGGVPETDAAVSADVTSGSKVGWNAGFRWEVDEAHRIAIGGVYRKSPRFGVNYVASYSGGVTGTYSCDGAGGTTADAANCGAVKIPDDYSFGISGALLKNLVVAVDVQRVLYSQLNDTFSPVFSYRGCAGSLTLSQCLASSAIQRAIPVGESSDATLVRVGGEWAFPFPGGMALFVRGGWYREPAHATKVNLYPALGSSFVADTSKPPVELTAPPYSAALHAAWDGGKADDHVTFGLGASLGQSFSVDVGADIGKTNTYVSVSAFYRFR